MDSTGVIRIAQITNLKMTADTSKISVTGTLVLISGSYPITGTVQNKKVSLSFVDSSKDSLTGLENTAGDQIDVVLASTKEKICLKPA